MDYADAGVDIEESDAAVAALAARIGGGEGDYAGLVEHGDEVLALTTDGVGTKILVAEAMDDYSTVGIDCVAMNVNDLIAMNVEPLAFVDYLVVDEPDDRVSAEIGEGLAEGAERADVRVVGGETAVMPEVVDGVDLAGSCVGVASPEDVIDGSRVEPGDALVGIPSNGVHSNGLTLARKALTGGDAEAYHDEVPYKDATVGEELLEPTRIYTEVLELTRDAHDVRGTAHITGGGFTNLERVADARFVVDSPLPAQPIFDLIAERGEVAEDEMYRTFNMGTGFVLVVPDDEADETAEAVEGDVIGHVEDGEGVVVDGVELS
ncbi:MAG: phosphoribosylformylglycinamidine cyclo-ligase [Halobacteriales archaeon]|nr:phosphoribosylformylglycinamidine cyclo-ligase [Halobacteriales archaeon]